MIKDQKVELLIVVGRTKASNSNGSMETFLYVAILATMHLTVHNKATCKLCLQLNLILTLVFG